MWLRDDLGRRLPTARIFIYGYDTMLEMSSSFQSLEDLGLSFKSDLVSLFYAHFRVSILVHISASKSLTINAETAGPKTTRSSRALVGRFGGQRGKKENE